MHIYMHQAYICMYLHAYTCYQSELRCQCRQSRYLRINGELKQLYLLDKAIAGEQLHPASHISQPSLSAAHFHEAVDAGQEAISQEILCCASLGHVQRDSVSSW